MILGKSIDKVKIKKIPVRAWSLTDEIEATLLSLLENNEKIPDDKMHLLKAFYESMPASDWNKKPVLKLITGGKEEVTKPAEPVAAVVTPAPVVEAVATPTPEVTTAPAPTPEAVVAAPTPAAEATAAPVVEAAATPTPAVEAAPTATVSPQLITNPIQVPVKEITVNDFLIMRKDGFRALPSEQKISPGYAVLYDITFDQILFFTEKPFKPGQLVVVEFCIPKSFTLCATIRSIVNVSFGSRIINQQPVNYRVIATFSHTHLGDRTLIRNFLNSIDQRENINPA